MHNLPAPSMYYFKNDYSEGAHPLILQKLAECNDCPQDGYGADEYSQKARAILQEQLQQPEAAIYFASGGTQTNLMVIATLLRPHEAVISAHTGHIYANETGAIEATGHRIIPVSSADGKLSPEGIEQVLLDFSLRPHVVKPRMVYISNATETGTVYRKAELEALTAVCRRHDLYLFMDGARIGHALTSAYNDLTLPDLARLTDVFYIGGTKNGALIGEAIVFNRPDLAPDFDYTLKQRGALLAKGRLLGIQFQTLFTDNLYFRLAQHANQMAARIARTFQELNYPFLAPPESNQLFPILPLPLIEQLSREFAFYTWKTVDEQHAAIRLITSWATGADQVTALIHSLRSYQPYGSPNE